MSCSSHSNSKYLITHVKIKTIVDVDLLSHALSLSGFNTRNDIRFGYIDKWFENQPDGNQPYGMIRVGSEDVGFRLSHRFVFPQDEVSVEAVVPCRGDLVFLIPVPPHGNVSRTTALVWGLIKELPPKYHKKEDFFDYILGAVQDFRSARKARLREQKKAKKTKNSNGRLLSKKT